LKIIRKNNLKFYRNITYAFLALIMTCSTLYGQIYIPKDFDFSYCGYAGNDKPIPLVKAIYVVEPIEGDATDLIQQAIDEVSALPIGKDGFRGAVLLGSGRFKIYGKLVISASGVVLRGSEGTVLVAAGLGRRTLIEIKGVGDAKLSKRIKITDALVKPGRETLSLESVEGLNVGDDIFIIRPSTQEWIAEFGMDQFVGLFEWRLNWRAKSRDVT